MLTVGTGRSKGGSVYVSEACERLVVKLGEAKKKCEAECGTLE